MAGILNLISTSSQNNEERYKLVQDFLANRRDVPFDNGEADRIQNTILSLINNRLNQAETRHDGLKLLSEALPRCRKDILIKYSFLWMAKALQTLDTARNDARQVTTACRVVAGLAVYSKDIPELQKHISTQNVKQLISHVNNLPEDKRFAAIFYLVAVLLYHYPEPCERLQATLRKLILPLIDAEQENLVRAGSKCFALLTFATERSFRPPDNRPRLTAWTYSQILICNSLHETMDTLFTGITEVEHVDIWDKLALPDISANDTTVYYLELERRFINLCVFLGTILRGCGTKNSVSPSNIFKVLSRGLFVTPAGLGNENTFRKQILRLILPNLHSSLSRVLDAMISGFGKELAPYAQTTLRLLHQVLTWTGKATDHSETLDGRRAFGTTRIQAYRSLSTWLMHAGVLSGLEDLCEEFLSHILKDIVPPRDRVVLSVQKTHNMSKRALKRHREKQYDDNSVQSSVTSVSSPLLNADLAEAALLALQNIFMNTGSRLKLSFYETSQKVVVSLLYNCYLETSDQTFYKRSKSCRLNLMKTLRTLQLNPHPSIAPPTQYSLELYQMAQHDSDLNVREEAKIGLAEIEKIVHPAAPTLRLPILLDARTAENYETEVDARMNSALPTENTVTNFDEDLEPANERIGADLRKVPENDWPGGVTNIPSREESKGEVNTSGAVEHSRSDNNEESRRTDSTPVEIIEINLDGDMGKENDASKEHDSIGDIETIPSLNQKEVSVDGRNVDSLLDVDEPSEKRQNIENGARSPTIDNNEETAEGEKESDDDAAMFELFCDTVQEVQQ